MTNTIKQVKRALESSHLGMQTGNMVIKQQYVVEMLHIIECLNTKVEELEEKSRGEL